MYPGDGQVRGRVTSPGAADQVVASVERGDGECGAATAMAIDSEYSAMARRGEVKLSEGEAG